ncbi:MAG: filamentous hemagglutinin N-terminal domain-containing protein, partial [Armatimonadetes bacterium]|nr:filamentous hemagglutinin N-terminal domain-containing protein [Akkermansiaceae bacterium]
MKPKFIFTRKALIGRITIGAPVFFGFAISISGLGSSQAGDILRGGGSTTSAPTAGASSTTGVTTPADTSQARANAQDALARTTTAINAVRAMQDAARAAAQAGPDNLGPNLPTVPNGLGSGALQVAPGAGTDPSLWQGAELPTQTQTANGLVNVGIRQTAQQALLQWQTFNVGKQTTLTFDQSAAGANANQWIAFNQINDPTGNPSQILGQIKAQGQIYIINPNGVIFGGSSQVDVNTLTVSSLPINSNLIQRGLLNNPDSQFLFSGLNLPGGTNGTPAFIPTPPPASTGIYGDVTIQAGAKISTPVSADGNGGRVLLVGPNVSNSGSILTPNGQTILAAGLQVGLAAHNSSDPSLRGLDVFVGQVGAYGGSSSNTGIISSPRGSISIAGKNITQNGALTATTSVSLNGRIDISAHYDATQNPGSGSSGIAVSPFLLRKSGTVSLGDGSVIEILPEYSSKETSIGTQLALRSQINLEGLNIYLGKNSTLLAPNALVRIATGEWIFQSPVTRFIQSAGQVYLDQNALINVAGSIDVPVSVAQNIISVDLRGAELANSPLQRTGPLRGQSVQVDIRDVGVYQQSMWIGTPLADIAGFANLIQRGVGQLTTAGGSVTISAGQSTVVQQNAKVDVSGGSIAYQEAVVRTTQLVSQGRLIDISQARPDIIYEGIFDGSFDASNFKFGTTEIYSSALVPGGGRLEQGYLQGSAGGTLTLTTPAAALDGVFLGKTFTGGFQRATPPDPSSLILNFTSIDRSYAGLPIFAPTPPAITFQAANPHAPADPFQTDASGNPNQLRADRIADVYLSPDLLNQSGFTNFSLNNPDGSITLPENTTLSTLSRGNLTFTASNITINGSIIAPGASLNFNSANISLSTINFLNNNNVSESPPAVADRGQFVLGNGAVISTAGLLVDDRPAAANSGSEPLFLNGGSVSIQAFDTTLRTGGTIDVSGGARADVRGRISYGSGGSLTLAGGQDINISSVIGGSLNLGANLLGHSGTSAGSLSITALAIQIGGGTPDPSVLLLGTEFFNQGGFGTFDLSGLGLADGTAGLLITEGTHIRPIVSTRLATALNDQPLR